MSVICSISPSFKIDITYRLSAACERDALFVLCEVRILLHIHGFCELPGFVEGEIV